MFGYVKMEMEIGICCAHVTTEHFIRVSSHIADV